MGAVEWAYAILLALFNVGFAWLLNQRQSILENKQALDLQQIQHRLDAEMLEFEKRFTSHYDKQIDVINELYGLMDDTQRNIVWLAIAVSENDTRNIPGLLEAASQSYRDLSSHYNSRRYYLDEETCELIDKYKDLLMKIDRETRILLHAFQTGDEARLQRLDEFDDFMNEQQPRTVSLRRQIEQRFRTIIEPKPIDVSIEEVKSESD